ncbi:MAG: hypothetical protein K2W96_24230, partial [Gemmataceae bacterium]|nr:hypothetical protein [Gemmataceae bacterium]
MTLPAFPAGLSVAELTDRFLRQQAEAHEQGLGLPEDAGDAVPHDATPFQPIDPQLAWADALAALPAGKPAVPPEWPALANGQAPAVSLAFALGNYPQQVRHIAALLITEPGNLREDASPGPARPELAAWAESQK